MEPDSAHAMPARSLYRDPKGKLAVSDDAISKAHQVRSHSESAELGNHIFRPPDAEDRGFVDDDTLTTSSRTTEADDAESHETQANAGSWDSNSELNDTADETGTSTSIDRALGTSEEDAAHQGADEDEEMLDVTDDEQEDEPTHGGEAESTKSDDLTYPTAIPQYLSKEWKVMKAVLDKDVHDHYELAGTLKIPRLEKLAFLSRARYEKVRERESFRKAWKFFNLLMPSLTWEMFNDAKRENQGIIDRRGKWFRGNQVIWALDRDECPNLDWLWWELEKTLEERLMDQRIFKGIARWYIIGRRSLKLANRMVEMRKPKGPRAAIQKAEK